MLPFMWPVDPSPTGCRTSREAKQNTERRGVDAVIRAERIERLLMRWHFADIMATVKIFSR